MITRFVRILSLTLLPLASLAQKTEQPQVRVARLERAVLAPCCYTESVAMHQSEIAVKMRLEIARWVAAGKSDQEILDTYSGLYGRKVLVDPRTMPRGWTPFFPWLVLLLGAMLVVGLLKRWSTVPRIATEGSPPPNVNLPDFDDE